MKVLFCFLIGCGVSLAADFSSGQAARALIGQSTFTSTTPGSTANRVGGISGIAYGADTLFVADSNRFGSFGAPDGSGNPQPNNNRVLVFNGLSNAIPQPTANYTLTSNPCPICVGSASLVLGQPDFNTTNYTITSKGMRAPTAVATDGKVLAVADTDNNRILIWRNLPTQMDQAADVVIGQPDFTHAATALPPNSKSLRGPQGLWIQNGKLFVADTQDHRVLIYNSIPTSNNAAADVVLGEPNFTTTVPDNLVDQASGATASNMLSPVGVSSDGTHLFVVDLGHNRVLVWNRIPTANGAPADLAIGQPDLISGMSNNAFNIPANVTQDTDGNNQGLTPVLCQSTGMDSNGTALFPSLCEKTLSFPRAVLAAGGRLFIADGGNDRVLIYNTIPTTSGAAADVVLGQPDFITDRPSTSADSMQTPAGLAWDGTNLYVSDTFNVRVLLFSIGENALPISGVRNSASREIFALGDVTIGGTLTEKDTVTISIGADSNATAKDYTYTVTADDAKATADPDLTNTLQKIVTYFVNNINCGAATCNSGTTPTPDPNVTATPNLTTLQVIVTAKHGGEAGASVTLATSTSTSATITAATSGATLNLNYQDAAQIAPGTIISLFAYNGASISDITKDFNPSRDCPPTATQCYAPPSLAAGGAMTQLYVDGFAAPLLAVSPSQINAQIPWELGDRTSSTAWVRIQHADGSVTVTTPVAVTLVTQNPGIYADDSQGITTDPRPGLVYHASSYATGAISVDGSVTAGDVATITITSADGTVSNTYNYTVLAACATPPTGSPCDTLNSIRDNLVSAINNSNGGAGDPLVVATPSNIYTRIELTAKLPGNLGNGITYAGSANSTANVIITPLGTATCCANTAGAQVTNDNPAIPGENLFILATGLGPDAPRLAGTGQVAPMDGSLNSPPTNPVDSILAGGSTANVIFAKLMPGTVGVWQVEFQLNSSLTDNPLTQLTIAQQAAVSNVVTFPVKSPPASSTGVIANGRQGSRK
jgi:uncharacterized protein (TIGR03437 family)